MTQKNIDIIEYEFDFQFSDKPGFWVRADIKVYEALEVIKTGLWKNQQISKVKLFAIDEANFVYDINAAKSGGQPWSTLAS